MGKRHYTKVEIGEKDYEVRFSMWAFREAKRKHGIDFSLSDFQAEDIGFDTLGDLVIVGLLEKHSGEDMNEILKDVDFTVLEKIQNAFVADSTPSDVGDDEEEKAEKN